MHPSWDTEEGVVFEEYLGGLPEDRRESLRALIAEVAAAAPDAVEGRSYGQPAFRYRDRPLLGFAVSSKHLSVFAFSPQIIAEVTPLLEGFSISKGTIRFTPEQPVPTAVLREMVARRRAEIDGA